MKMGNCQGGMWRSKWELNSKSIGKQDNSFKRVFVFK